MRGQTAAGLLSALAVAATVAVGVAPPDAALASTTVGTPDPTPGVYQVWGNADAVKLPYVKGGQIVLEWSQIEPARGRFDWTKLDTALASYASMGKSATVQVNSTTSKPDWIWDTIAYCGTTKNQQIPQYWDAAFLTLNTEMVQALAARLKSSANRNSIALVRSSPNAIGTELTDVPAGTTCQPARNGNLSSIAWTRTVAQDYYQKIMGSYRTALNPEINFAHRTQLYTTKNAPLDWLGTNDAWIMGTASDIDSNPLRDAFDVFAVNWSRPGRTQAYWEPIQTAGKKHLVSDLRKYGLA